MLVDVVDPSAYTPPYDHALCAALARAGAEVELVTSRFAYGPVPAAEGYERAEPFYRAPRRRGATRGRPGSRARLALKLAEHVPDMLRYRRWRAADVVHFQWLTVQPLDVHLLPPPAGRAHRARRAAARAAARPAARASAASTSAWTRWSCTPSTAASGSSSTSGVRRARA